LVKPTIVFASSNPGKIQELTMLLNDLPIEIIPQNHFHLTDAAETAGTFVENALIKARHACIHTGLPAIADDSGLEVVALKGAPGIYSARFAGEKATSDDNIQKLLSLLNTHPNRTAYFQCVLVFLLHPNDPTPLICQGTWRGEILRHPDGKQGFGYDPVFFDPDQQCSAAELSLALKNQISHRGKALRSLLEKLPEKLGHACSV
jgi:XTP/dITP diphosphohydrolase